MSSDKLMYELIDIVKKVVSEVQSGNDINIEIAKAAKENNLNQEKVNRVVEWTNTLLMLKQYKRGEPKEKEFDLADPKVIKDKLNTELQENTVDKVKQELEGNPYEMDEKDYTFLSEKDIQKEGSLSLKEYPRDPAGLMKQVLGKIEQLSKIAEDSRIEVEINKNKALNCLEKIADNLNKITSYPFFEFEKNARRTLGDEILPLIDILEKQANTNYRTPLKNISKEFYNSADENVVLLKQASNYLDLSLACNFLYKEADLGVQNWKKQLKVSLDKVIR